jgi:hypothetical protein
MPEVPLGRLMGSVLADAPEDARGGVHFRSPGVRVTFPARAHPVRLDVGLSTGQSYVARWIRDGAWVGSSVVQRVGGEGLAPREVEVPADVTALGADAVELLPRGEQGTLGSLRLIGG